MVAVTRSQKKTSAEARLIRQLTHHEEKIIQKIADLQRVCLRGVIEDVESHIHRESSLVHSISLKAFVGKCNGDLRLEKELIIFNNPVINHPDLQCDVPDPKEAKENYKLHEKVKTTANYVHESGLEGKNVEAKYVNSVFELMHTVVKFLNENGNKLYGHNLLGDLIFLLSTQKFCGGKIAVKDSIKKEDKISTSINIPGWSEITHIDTLPTLSFYANNTLANYKKWSILNNEASLTQRKDYRMSLEVISRFVEGNTKKTQSHICSGDTEDLFRFMQLVAKTDGIKSLMSDTNRLGKFMPGRPVFSDYTLSETN